LCAFTPALGVRPLSKIDDAAVSDLIAQFR
jgi:hypothetical protein